MMSYKQPCDKKVYTALDSDQSLVISYRSNDKMKRDVWLFLLVAFMVGLIGCTSTATQEQNLYADSTQWISLPLDGNKSADVFYLYPTVYVRSDDSAPLFSERNDEKIRNAASMAYHLQATAFEEVANVYAPMYRQVDASYVLSLPFADRDAVLEQAPLVDAVAAFDYYIQHYNNGRPFILAGHSQGSEVLRLLLATYMPLHPEVYDRMIAAYCIGISITSDFLDEHPFLKFAQRENDTQVIISYNTEAPGVTEANPLVRKNALVINPLSWTRGEESAGVELNLGSALLDRTGSLIVLPEFADAKLDLSRSVVLCSTVDEKLPTLASSALFPKGVYHSFDYSLYYKNISENALKRITAYQNQ